MLDFNTQVSATRLFADKRVAQRLVQLIRLIFQHTVVTTSMTKGIIFDVPSTVLDNITVRRA